MVRHKIIKNDARAHRLLDKCPQLYMVGRWAHYGVMEFPFAGKHTPSGVPYVWMYYDGNGTCDEWHRVPLDYVTTGTIYGWTISRAAAEKIANALNFKEDSN